MLASRLFKKKTKQSIGKQKLGAFSFSLCASRVTELSELDPLRDEGYHEPPVSLCKATWRLAMQWSSR